MSEKHYGVQWKDFKSNVSSAFRRLRADKDFTNVTLVCEDGQQMEAHKLILAVSSPFFEKIFQKNKHPHPLIYLKGSKSEDMQAILDFLYLGEANVHNENLDSFLAIAEEFKLKELASQSSVAEVEYKSSESTQQQPKEPPESTEKNFDINVGDIPESKELDSTFKETPMDYICDEFTSDLEALDTKVRSWMQKLDKQIIQGKDRRSGNDKKERVFACKVCGKKGRSGHIQDHIEANHLLGISLPCNFCGKTYPSRASLRMHRGKFHK